MRARTFLSVGLLSTAFTFAGTFGLGTPIAFADTPSAADKDTARRLMGDGNTAFGAGDFKKAVEAFGGAHAIMNLPTTGLGLMRSQEKLGLLLEARDTALGITRIPEKPSEPKPEQSAREEAKTLADSLASRIPTLELAISGLAGTTAFVVTVDGQELASATATLPRKANPGNHEVLVRARAYLDVKQTVMLGEGQNVKVPVVMSRDPSFKEPTKPEAPKPEKPKPAPLVPIAPPPSHGAHPLLWVGVATTAAGLAVGVSTGVAVLVTKKNCAKDKPAHNCPLVLANVSNAGFAVAGVGAILTAVGIGLSVGRGSEPKKSVYVMPELGLGYAGLRGAF